MSQPLPAYARELANARRRGLTLKNPTVSVVLHGLRRPTIGYGVTVPDDREPGSLDWSWTRGLEVFVFRTGDPADRLRSALRAIKRARPKRLLVIDCGNPKTISIIDPDRIEATRAA